jgi:protein SCO1/2
VTLRAATLLGCVVVLASSALARPASAVGEAGATLAPRPKALEGTEILDKLGAKVPLDVKLTNDDGQVVRLADYFPAARRPGTGTQPSGEEGGAPVLLTLGYYQCPMLCSLVLNATLEALQKVSLDVGEDFRVVTVSIDPKETVALAKQKRDNYLAEYGREGAAKGWRFHVADEAAVKRLAEAVGFQYRYDEEQQQYAHGAGIFFLSPDGTLTRTLYGLSYSPVDVKFALMEASRGEVGSVTDRILMSCFQYTPDGQKYGVYVWGVMRLGGILTILFLGTMLFVLWRRERRKNASSRTSA